MQGFSVKTNLVMTLCIPLSEESFISLISSNTTTLDANEAVKDQFYNQLHTTLCMVLIRDQFLLLVDFNARFGKSRL